MSRLIIELPEGMTQQEREDLADALHDSRMDWRKQSPSMEPVCPMPQCELDVVENIEEALRQEAPTGHAEGEPQKNRSELFRLMLEHPELPVLPMVDTEVVAGDEYGRWIGAFGKAEVREYAIDEWHGDGLVRFRDDSGAEESLIEGIAEVKYDGTEADYEKAKKEAEALWTKAIILNIDLPDRGG